MIGRYDAPEPVHKSSTSGLVWSGLSSARMLPEADGDLHVDHRPDADQKLVNTYVPTYLPAQLPR